MRELDVSLVTETVAHACISVNYALSPDMTSALTDAADRERSSLGQNVLSMLRDNLSAAKEQQIPICQDTGMAVIFLSVGQDLHFIGGNLTEAVQAGVRRGYEAGYLRRSVVRHPLDRVNTGDNTPAVIHTEIVPGDRLTMTVTAKGFGSENCSRLYMLKPSDGTEGVKNAVIRTVREAGPNACPPMVVGVGIGGTFEKCALMAKHALTRPLGQLSADPVSASLEQELLERINGLQIGPAGLGGDVTALGVAVETYPTHIAGLPVAVNLCCHVNRHITLSL